MTEEEARKKWPVLGKKHGHSKGYVRLLSPSHPNANADGYVYKHIYIASAALSRGLKKPETVHHIDGNTSNDCPFNLLICTHAYHRWLHHLLAKSSVWPQFSTIKSGNKPECRVCDAKISYTNKTGLCIQHYWYSIRHEKSKCHVPDCKNLAGSRSGLCLKHVIHRSNKRRHNRTWNYSYG